MVALVDPLHMLVAEFFSEDGWKLDKLKEWIPDWVLPLIHDTHIYPEQEDRMVWLRSSIGEFSLKGAWNSIHQRRESSQVDRMVWNGVTPLKFSFFVWRLVRDILLLEMTLKRVGIPVVSRCLCCGQHEELWRHLFITGPVVVQCSSSPGGGEVRHIRTVVPLSVLWCLWKARNNARFEGMRLDDPRVIKMVDQLLGQLSTTGVLLATHLRGDTDDPWAELVPRPIRQLFSVAVSWKRPQPPLFKLNTNASVSQGRATGGGILRDSSGRVVFAFYKEFGDTKVLTAEGLALLQGLQFCQERQVQGLLVEVDSQVLVHLIQSGTVSKWPLCNMLRRIRHLLASLASSCSHIFQEANSSADLMANLRWGTDFFCTSHQQLPSTVRASILLDAREFLSV
ncbi:uncharacterized protein LOC113771125 [Coffea eugenioides]|uniref:uncharacterized protein LOC113771125 n=1 Tax=Coffea eugenioides TaxID=49369 RepID=UPI000F60FD85|nr:uncharacterized protein LOC113771125 [Coffea eugenioides]